jgi:DNA-3-methyladenine glycosylase I
MRAMAGFGVSPSQPTVATLADGRTRCSWVTGTGMELVAYHDDAFRRAFRNFDPAAVAALTGRDVNRLLADRSIIRHRGKIEATIHNARLAGTGSSWPDLVWAHAPRVQPVLERWADGRMSSPESHRLSADLKRLGYRYIGPVVAHSFMQTVGMENGHFAGCFRTHSRTHMDTAAPPPP